MKFNSYFNQLFYFFIVVGHATVTLIRKLIERKVLTPNSDERMISILNSVFLLNVFEFCCLQFFNAISLFHLIGQSFLHKFGNKIL